MPSFFFEDCSSCFLCFFLHHLVCSAVLFLSVPEVWPTYFLGHSAHGILYTAFFLYYIYRKLRVRVAFRKGRTLESILCRLKFREPSEKSKNNIYKRNCKKLQLYIHWRDKPISTMQRSRTQMQSKLVAQTIVFMII